jgi:putative CocE/NonD family hydrolase
MKNLFVLICLVFCFKAKAQKLYFPATNFKDSATLANSMPALATQVMAHSYESSKEIYFNRAVVYLMVAKNYRTAIDFLDSLQNTPGANSDHLFLQRVYALSKLKEAEGTASFADAYKRTFNVSYPSLSRLAKKTVYAFTSPFKATGRFKELMEKQEHTDSISFEDAGQLVEGYYLRIEGEQVLPVIKPLLAKEDKTDCISTVQLVKTRDGSLVQVHVVRPAGIPEKLPVVFVFNIYAVDSAKSFSFGKRYAYNDYAYVVANTRGKAASPQDVEPFEHDANDAYDVIDWITKQPWSNGKVGMTGGSYLGFSQWAATKKLHPALKTIIPKVSVGAGIDYPMLGNVFMSYMLRWIRLVSNNKFTDDQDFSNQKHWDSTFAEWYRQGVAFRKLDAVEGRNTRIFQRWLQHPAFDKYWQNMASYANDFSRINIPVLTMTGYFDDDQNGAMYYYRQHYLHNPQANNYLVIGPYSHSGAAGIADAELYGYKVDPAATAYNFSALTFGWFDYILKDSSKPALLKDKVNYEIMGANEWRHAPSLKAMSNDTLTFYLGNTRVNENYKLNARPNANEFIKQEVNLGTRKDDATTGNFLIYADEYKIIRPALQKNNAISFVTGSFTEPVIISGSFSGQLSLSINKRDLDVIVHLYELQPDGNYFDLGWSLQRASYAKNRSKRKLLHPGKKEYFPITYSFMTCKQLSKGSRLVITVGVSKSPDWQINYGTGKDVSDETIADAKEPLELKWFGDSFIKVPVWK